MKRLAIVTSHPIQYYAPWFRYLANNVKHEIKIFYLWDFGVTKKTDIDFQQPIQWDIPLLDGYNYEFVPNISPHPGTHHFWGLQNPSLVPRLLTYKPDAVLLMNYNYASFYRLLVTWNTQKIPLLFRGDSHRLVSNNDKFGLKRQFITQIYRRFAAYLYVGQANYDYFRYHHISDKQLFFSPHAVDNERFFSQSNLAKDSVVIWKQELGIPQNHAVILFVGKFENKKRPLDLLQAFIKANLEDVSLLFVGAGYLEEDLKSQAAQYKNIYFAPFQNQSFMPRTYAAGDLLVLPSYGSGETWGLVVNEAMCLSKPVIVSNHVGCAYDLVKQDHNGLIFPAGDVSALAHSLKEAFSSGQLLRWGENSRKIISNYSYLQTTEGLVEALQAIGGVDALSSVVS